MQHQKTVKLLRDESVVKLLTLFQNIFFIKGHSCDVWNRLESLYSSVSIEETVGFFPR